MWAVARIAAVVVILLAIILAMVLIGSNLIRASTITGGNENRFELGDVLHTLRKTHTDQGSPPPAGFLEPHQKTHSVAGGKEESWTRFKTWPELFENEKARTAYFDDVDHALNTLDLDWSGVRAELGEKLYDDREWAGRINLVDGKPKIVELVPSPHAVGEGPLAKQAAAMVPAEVVEELEKKPALFMFHTHPGEVGGSAMPSATDVAGAMWSAYTHRFAADLVISPYGVFMYTPNVDFRSAVWSDGTNSSNEALLVLYRRIADMLAAMEGSRSWASPWTLADHAKMLQQYDVDYIVFPTDKYAQVLNRNVYTSPPAIDHEHLHDYHERIRELEKEASDQKIVSAPAKTQSVISAQAKKRVRFADE